VPGGVVNGSVAGTRDGSPNGIEGGAPKGVPVPPGQTVNGDDRNDRRTGTGAGGGEAASTGTRAGDTQPTTLDQVVRYAGYYNLEFGNEGGESGGVPGGSGSFSGAAGQAAYLALVAIDIILTVLTGGAKAALKGALSVAKGVLRRALALASRLLTRDGLKAAAKKLVRSIAARTSRLFTRISNWWRQKWFSTFYSVQNPTDVSRLLHHGGEPWPTGVVNNSVADILGRGLYTFATRESAEAYRTLLASLGAKELRVLAHRISNKALSTLKTADMTKMSDEAATLLLEIAPNHGFEHVIRMTGKFGIEHFFKKEVFPLFKNWVL
jgi:hypothetical protein